MVGNRIPALERTLIATNIIIVELKAAQGTNTFASISALASAALNSVSNLTWELRKRAVRGKDVIIIDVVDSGNVMAVLPETYSITTEIQVTLAMISILRLYKGSVNRPGTMVIKL